MKCKALGRFTTLDDQICKLRRALRMRGDDPKGPLRGLRPPVSEADASAVPPRPHVHY